MGFANIIRWMRPPVRVEHVRYVKQPAITYREKAHAIALSIGRADLAEKLK